MNVTAYFTTEDKRKLNKTLTLVVELTNVNLLQGTSKLTPVFILDGVLDKEINYIYVPDFKRYYFVNDIRILNGQLTELTCNVDVLMSFKSDILNVEGTFVRAPSNNNALLNDTFIPIQCNTKSINKKFENSGEMLQNITPSNISFILTCYE